MAATKGFAAPSNVHPVRPPGSLPEEAFLQACIRCGECFQACPNDVLQPAGFEHGLAGLWTPQVNANWAGCESSCNNCGQVCPTGAIRALPMEEKRVARMGLAKVEPTCLPLAGKEACQLCVDECNAAGYHAIEFMRVHPKLDETGLPIDGSGFSAPVVMADKCVGCGFMPDALPLDQCEDETSARLVCNRCRSWSRQGGSNALRFLSRVARTGA